MKRFILLLTFFPCLGLAEKLKFPPVVYLNNISLEAGVSNDQVDVINMFSDHLVTQSKPSQSYSLKSNIRFFQLYELTFAINYKVLEIDNTSEYTLEKTELDYSDFSVSGSYQIKYVTVSGGFGQKKLHTFLETDTEYYFHKSLTSPYVFAKVNYLYPTKSIGLINLFAEMGMNLSGQNGDVKVDEGNFRRWGANIFFGNEIQWGLTLHQTYDNVKFIHEYLGLNNEMNNLQQTTFVGLFLSYRNIY